PLSAPTPSLVHPMKMSPLPQAIPMTSALALGDGGAERNDDIAHASTDAERAEADQPADPLTTRAQQAQTQTAAASLDPNDAAPNQLGDGRDSDQPVDDTWITTKVKSSLLADTDVAGLDINVDTLNGVVTLRGEVDSQAQIDEATRIAREIEGVTNVDASGLTTANR